MIPTIFFAMTELPLTLTGKTNRKLLRDIGASFSVKQVTPQIAIQAKKKLPRTDAEYQLRDLWARIFNVANESIGADDNLFRLGGDSIAAMKLVESVSD
jgi:hypothetical protein